MSIIFFLLFSCQEKETPKMQEPTPVVKEVQEESIPFSKAPVHAKPTPLLKLYMCCRCVGVEILSAQFQFMF